MAKKAAKKSKSSKSSKSKKSSKSSSSSKNFGVIGQYLVSKNKKTKYIKIEASPKAEKAVKVLVKKLIALLGTDVLFVNLMDDDFKEKYKIPDFVKGRISVDMDADEAEESDDEDDEDDDDSDDEDEDDESDDDEDEDDEDSDDDEDEDDEDDDSDF